MNRQTVDCLTNCAVTSTGILSDEAKDKGVLLITFIGVIIMEVTYANLSVIVSHFHHCLIFHSKAEV